MTSNNLSTNEVVSLTRMQLGKQYRFRWQPQTSEQGAPSDGTADQQFS